LQKGDKSGRKKKGWLVFESPAVQRGDKARSALGHEGLTISFGDRTLVYHGEQTFAVVTLAPNGLMKECELIEAM
jgi:hypothetical protein